MNTKTTNEWRDAEPTKKSSEKKPNGKSPMNGELIVLAKISGGHEMERGEGAQARMSDEATAITKYAAPKRELNVFLSSIDQRRRNQVRKCAHSWNETNKTSIPFGLAEFQPIRICAMRYPQQNSERNWRRRRRLHIVVGWIAYQIVGQVKHRKYVTKACGPNKRISFEIEKKLPTKAIKMDNTFHRHRCLDFAHKFKSIHRFRPISQFIHQSPLNFVWTHSHHTESVGMQKAKEKKSNGDTLTRPQCATYKYTNERRKKKRFVCIFASLDLTAN